VLSPLGIDSAVVEIEGGAFNPLVYVMPAPTDDGVHAAWYSATHGPRGRSAIEALSFTYGRCNGEPFLHCHGVWRHPDGSRHAGHLMPHDARFAEPVKARVFAVSGAILDQLEDEETRFRLFFVEKILPYGRRTGTATGIALIVLGIVVASRFAAMPWLAQLSALGCGSSLNVRCFSAR
jgi:hypothetical protein